VNNKTKAMIVGAVAVAAALVFFPKLYVGLAQKLGKHAELKPEEAR
jgi:hypothetical protein